MTPPTPTNNRRLVLASSSPRRRQLLAEAGFEFDVIPPTVVEPEQAHAHISPAAFAEALSFLKASSVARACPDAIVLGADTVVALGDDLYGKPADKVHARRILSTLSHNPHEVITGIAIIDTDTQQRCIAHDVTRVTMRPMSEDDLEAYLATGLWEGKAGAYGIQDHDDQFVLRLEGSFSNVVGLPMERVCELLKGKFDA